MPTILKRVYFGILEWFHDWTQDPPQSAYRATFNVPITRIKNARLVRRRAYTTLNDLDARLPVWVMYDLTPEHCDGPFKRSNAFTHDKSLPKGQRAELIDYDGSGYDRGHMADDQDMRWNKKVEKESFILSNICPQLPAFNRGIWKVLENTVRGWCLARQNNFRVYLGPVYNYTSKTIGENKVVVPDGFYRIIVDVITNETIAFLFPHGDLNSDNLAQYQASVADIEKRTNIVFTVPDNKNQKCKMWK